jgi:hypothetical protein
VVIAADDSDRRLVGRRGDTRRDPSLLVVDRFHVLEAVRLHRLVELVELPVDALRVEANLAEGAIEASFVEATRKKALTS